MALVVLGLAVLGLAVFTLPTSGAARSTFGESSLSRGGVLSPRLRRVITFEAAVKYQNFVASVALPGQHLASPVIQNDPSRRD